MYSIPHNVANFDVQNNGGELLILCSNGETEKAEELLIGGANIDQVDEVNQNSNMREVEDAIVQLTPPNFKRNLLINYGHLLCEIMVIY